MSAAVKTTLARAFAIAWFALIFGMIAHKVHPDISALAQQHSGEEFRLALMKYFIGNLAGGTGPASK